MGAGVVFGASVLFGANLNFDISARNVGGTGGADVTAAGSSRRVASASFLKTLKLIIS